MVLSCLPGILDETPEGHEDRVEIPQVLEVIKALGKDTEPGVVSAKQKVELWRYNSNIVFKPGEWIVSLLPLVLKRRKLIRSVTVRIWIYWTKTVPSFIQADYFASRKEGWIGVAVGANCLYYYLTIIVSTFCLLSSYQKS